ncbi:lysylphosphatidylglycerol synthase transmembrane domain-containing protein [Flammeovirga agarivorans]|uniref:Flippase-like domain-containing protein n=1 Tax=Flammeovirga agarivorans TaxID=2726742 RepID=A0A7X8XUI9_9BACT|nr:lysylphosphatidylglycerol synthase domain-containing protein [Flammeovirga agarivorans]NLR90391.1 flippase-like domain-containing protein [Flammeovirga agarivorans]
MVKKKQFNIFLKIIAAFLILIACYEFFNRSPWEKITLEKKEYILLAGLLMPFNWLMEAYRWRLLIQPLVKLSYIQSLKGVLSGLAGSFLAGRTIGGTLGRYWSLPPEVDRKQSIAALFVGNSIQGAFTFFFGALALLILFKHKIHLQLPFNLWHSLLAFLLFVVIGFLAVKKADRLKVLVENYLQVVLRYSLEIIAKVTLGGLFRYILFTAQFVLVIKAFGVEESWGLMFLLVPIIYFIKTMTPSLTGVLDLGARELSALYIFEVMDANTNVALMASLIIWAINILIPSLIGLSVRWKL